MYLDIMFKIMQLLFRMSHFEIQRNEVIYVTQGDRKPFINNPYLATSVWRGTVAENKWN